MRLTNIEVANTLGLSQSMVSRMRTGYRGVSLETLESIAKAYNVDRGELLTALSKAKAGNKFAWIDFLDKIFVNQEEDPDAPPVAPESVEPEPAEVPTPEFSS